MCTFYQKIVVFTVYLYNPIVHNLHVYGYCLNIPLRRSKGPANNIIIDIIIIITLLLLIMKPIV